MEYTTNNTNEMVKLAHSEKKGLMRIFNSENYNFVLNIYNGSFYRWGKTFEDDPLYSQFGPEICDMEISNVCSNGCKFCYKGNTSVGDNMNFETFKKIFNKLPKTVGQIAFGIGNIDANEDLFEIMDYCWKNDYNPFVVPNITINGTRMTDEYYDDLSKYCGAVAVSRYPDTIEECYDAVYNLATVRNKKQINIHQLISEETYDNCFKVVEDVKNNPKLKDLRAVVFMSLKNKGPRNNYHVVNQEMFNKLSNYLLDSGINFGFDSCGSAKFMNAIKGHERESYFNTVIEPCESFGFFSSYINSKGLYFPCSFCERSHDDFMDGFDVLNCNDFVKDIWNSDLIVKWRNIMVERKMSGNCSCPIFDV